MAGKACMGNLIESAYENEQLGHPRYSFKMKNGFDYGDYKNIDINQSANDVSLLYKLFNCFTKLFLFLINS